MEFITDHLDIWTAGQAPKTAGRGKSANNQSPHGIKKLRELILELAVRGKLVPQDPNDEPASVLLEKIAKEKVRLLKEGKIKKEKKLPKINMPEEPFSLPGGWEFCKLGTLVNSIASGGTPSKRNPNYWDGNIPWASVKDLGSDKYLLTTQDSITMEGLNAGSKLANTGDVLICTRMGLGKIAIAKTSVAINQDLKAVKLTSFLDVEYFLDYFSTLKLKGTGTTVFGIKQDQLLATIITLPPLLEQHRIVAKVDELMALCDQLEQQQTDSNATHQTLVKTVLAALTRTVTEDSESKENPTAIFFQHFDTLFTTEHSIDQLKQTILQLAVMGKLVPPDSNDEPASILLQSIAEEKTRLFNVGKFKNQKPSQGIKDVDMPFKLPGGWKWSHLSSLSLYSEAGWSPRCKPTQREAGKWGVLKVSAVTWGKFNPFENKELPTNLEPRAEIEVKPGDFLISRANTAELVARAVTVPIGVPKKLMMSDKIIRIVFSAEVSAEYIKLANNCVLSRAYYSTVAGGTSSSMKNVSREQVLNLLIGVPPLPEQHRIVAKVDELMTLCDILKTRLSDARTTQLQLADAIVEQAVA